MPPNFPPLASSHPSLPEPPPPHRPPRRLPPARTGSAGTVKTRDGRTLAFPDWLSKMPGFKVDKLEKGTVLHVRKDPKRRLRIPNLRLIEIDRSYMPPGRAFVED